MILRPRSLYKILGSCISLLSYAKVLLKLNFFCSKLLRFIYLAGTVPLLSLYSDAEFQYVHCLSVSSISSVQFSRSVVSDSLWPHEPQHTRPPCPSPTPRVYSTLMSIESVMPSSYLILCHPLLLQASILPSIRVFSSESVLHIKWPKYWSFGFSVSPSNEHPGLISFRMLSHVQIGYSSAIAPQKQELFSVSMWL